MAALLLMIMILVSGGCQNIRHLSVSQSEKDDADTGTGYNIYYINNDVTIFVHILIESFLVSSHGTKTHTYTGESTVME